MKLNTSKHINALLIKNATAHNNRIHERIDKQSSTVVVSKLNGPFSRASCILAHIFFDGLNSDNRDKQLRILVI